MIKKLLKMNNDLGRIVISIFIFCLTYSAFATEYYVSNSGNDSNNGLTEQTAWKTLDKVNAKMSSFTSGDVIAFKGGDEFFGTLRIANKNRITFTSYGAGKAVIKGTKELQVHGLMKVVIFGV